MEERVSGRRRVNGLLRAAAVHAEDGRLQPDAAQPVAASTAGCAVEHSAGSPVGAVAESFEPTSGCERSLPPNSAAAVLQAIRHDVRFATFRSAFEQFLEEWGFRSSAELMLTVPSLQEDPLPAIELLKQYAATRWRAPRPTGWHVRPPSDRWRRLACSGSFCAARLPRPRRLAARRVGPSARSRTANGRGSSRRCSTRAAAGSRWRSGNARSRPACFAGGMTSSCSVVRRSMNLEAGARCFRTGVHETGGPTTSRARARSPQCTRPTRFAFRRVSTCHSNAVPEQAPAR